MATNPNRKITEEQFVEGSTIDGTRIEKAFDDTYNKLNAVPKANLKQMFVPRTFHSGWQAGHFDPDEDIMNENTASPVNGFMPLYNSFPRDVVGNTGARTAVNNEWRWKGTQMRNGSGTIVAMPANSVSGLRYNYSDVVGKTWSFYLEKPSIITDIAVILERDVYSGLYREPPPERGIPTEQEFAHTNLNWWSECFLDSVFNADDKRKGSVLWRRVESPNAPRAGDLATIPTSDPPAAGMIPYDPSVPINWTADRSQRQPSNDFQPNQYQNATIPIYSGRSNHPVYSSWWDKNLNILVPQQSRLHFGFGFAINGPNGLPVSVNNYGDFSPYKFDTKFNLGYRYNIAIGFLELVEK